MTKDGLVLRPLWLPTMCTHHRESACHKPATTLSTPRCPIAAASLQEHMVGLLRGHQQHNQSLQLLGIIIAASAALSLVTTSSSWPICLLGCIMLGVVVSIVLPNCFDTSVSRIAAAVRGRRPAAAGADAELQQQLGRQSSRDMPTLDTVG